MTQALDAALPWGLTAGIPGMFRTEPEGGISTMPASVVCAYPRAFDTISLPEVRVSIQENTIIVSGMNLSVNKAPKWLNQTVSQIARLMWLPSDWHSDGSRPIERKAIENILAVLFTITESASSRPAVVPTARGGVQVEWHENGVDLEIEALNSGRVEFYFNGPGGEEEGIIGNPGKLKSLARSLDTVARYQA